VCHNPHRIAVAVAEAMGEEPVARGSVLRLFEAQEVKTSRKSGGTPLQIEKPQR
jgi:hypothetical protein